MSTRALGGALFGALLLAVAPPAPAALPTPAPPLPMLPSVARVRLEVARAHVVVHEDISLPRGAYRGGPLELFVAFAAPGAPLAFDAHLVPVPDGALEAEPDAAGVVVPFTRAPRRPAAVHAMLGPETMSGVVLHVSESDFVHALAPGGMAVLRLRYVVALPEEAADGGREVLVRLGASGSTPLTLGRLQIASNDAPLRRAEARLCGPEADPYPLAIARSDAAKESRGASEAERAPLAPVLAVRHTSDDLCVRFWTTPRAK